MKKTLRKTIALLLMLAMVLSQSSLAVFADTQQRDWGDKYYQYTAKYLDTYDDTARTNREFKYYYSDSYFKDTTKYNDHLAVMSLALAMATRTQAKASDALKDMGCDETTVTTKGYGSTSENGIGYAYGIKKMEDGRYLIPVLVRGLGYGNEWVANFNMGESGDSEGFSVPANTIVGDINAVISSEMKQSDEFVILVSGYSRGAAVSNLVGQRLTTTYGADSVVAYCYEPPAPASPGDTSYKNIHTVCNKNDGITIIPPTYMGFGLYGSTKTIGIGDESKMLDMMETLRGTTNGYESYNDFKWGTLKIDLDPDDGEYFVLTEGAKVEPSAFWTVVLNRAKDTIVPTRAAYNQIQDPLQDLVRLIQNMQPSQIDLLEDTIKDSKVIASLLLNSDVRHIAENIVLGWSLTIKDSDFKSVGELVYNKFFNRDEFSSDQKREAYSVCTNLIKPAYKYLKADYGNKQQTIGTLMLDDNIDRLIQCHYAEVNMAWLMLEDEFYTGNPPTTVDISGTVTWNDEAKPESATVNLFANGTKVEEVTVSAGLDGGFGWSFKELPMYLDGKKIEYTVAGAAVSGFDAAVAGDATKGFTITYSKSGTGGGGGDTPGGGGTGGGGGTTTFTVSFNMNGHGNAVASVDADENGHVSKPADPVADGYVFGGWFRDQQCTQEFNFATETISDNITLYAKWTKAEPAIDIAKVLGFKAVAGKKKLTLSWKKVTDASGYQVAYKLKTAKKYSYKTVKKAKTVKLVLKKLKKGKKYSVKVRAYVNGTDGKIYGAWSKTLTKKVK